MMQTDNSTLVNIFAAWAAAHGKTYDSSAAAHSAYDTFVANLKGVVSTNTDPDVPYWVS